MPDDPAAAVHALAAYAQGHALGEVVRLLNTLKPEVAWIGDAGGGMVAWILADGMEKVVAKGLLVCGAVATADETVEALGGLLRDAEVDVRPFDMDDDEGPA